MEVGVVNQADFRLGTLALLVFLAAMGVAGGARSQESHQPAASNATSEEAVPAPNQPAETPAPAVAPRSGARKIVAPTSALLVHRDPSADEIDVLESERRQDLETLVRRTQDFRSVVDGMVQRVYRMRRDYINSTYEADLQGEWALEEKTLKDAIEYFEGFLKKYPDSPPYTPDAMYRLGELYYDQSYFEYQRALEQYADAQEKGKAQDMEPPAKELTRTIDIFRRLIAKYPGYRSIDGAYYVLGYCLKEMGEEEESRLAWLAGVCSNRFKYDPEAFAAEKAKRSAERKNTRPAATLDTGVENQQPAVFVDPYEGCQPIVADSRFLFESWWLIGEYHFDYDTSRFGVETAMSAYKKLIEDPKHKLYERGLYKLAWSYYKADMYPEAIRTFSRVVDFSDSQSSDRGGSMRPEAIQYLAVCFFTDDWNVDQQPDPIKPVERLQDPTLMPQDRPWTREVYEHLGDIFADQEKNPDAISIWKMFIQKWPLDVRTPFVQEKIAIAYNKLRQPEDEIAARSELDKYGPGSTWWEANKDHPVEQNEVARMARDALLESAYHMHETAQNLKQRAQASGNTELFELAVQNYNLAAAAYRKFIEQNPDTPDAYDINYNLAQALYWSGQIEAARAEYRKVRDSNLDDKFRKDSAHMVIVCTGEMYDQKVKDGSIVMRDAPPELQGEPPKPNPLPIPPLALELMNEREGFLQIAPDHEEAGKFLYMAAQTYYRYGYWDEARTRYEAIFGKFCKTDPIAYVSWQTLMNMAVDQNNVDERERLALLQKDRQCSVEGIEQLTGKSDIIDIETVLGDVAMKRALDMLKQCMDGKDLEICSKAGDDLVAAVGKAPNHPNADKALHNAALAYEIAQRFDSAMKLYERIVNEYPKSEFVGKCLFQQAFAANNFFEYDKALSNYRILADEARFKDYENRVVSIYMSAYILTNLQRYADAIPYWERYSREEQDPLKSIEAAYNAADMNFKAKNWRRAMDAYQAFIKKYERNKAAGPYVVEASYRISLSADNLGRPQDQLKAWQRTIDLYRQLVNEPGSMSAEYAAESHFLLIEQDMREFEKFTIKGSMKNITDQRDSGALKVKNFEDRYREIAAYRRPEWSLAAEFRIGYAYEVYAKAMLATPLPPLEKEDKKALAQLLPEDREMVMAELEDKFRAELEKFVAPMEDKAQAEYKIAVELARRGNISNDWTIWALERINAYDPDNYPRQHNGVIEMEENTLAAPPWASEVQ